LEKDRYDVFLSHTTPDKPVVEELARLLTLRGIRPWLDKWDLVPGEPWQEAIEKALADCPACAVCIGAGGFGGWQTEEMNGAIQLQVGRERRRVIPVLLPGAERGERSALPLFLQGRTWVDFHGSLNEERVLRRLVRGIRGERPGPDSEDAVAEGVCPYWGLDYFDVGDSAFFHGREDLTGWLLAKLRPTNLDHRFLAIVGPSGSGKSSLARAGLLGALRHGEIPGSDEWRLAVCRPGKQPLESLAVALCPDDSPAAVSDLIRHLAADPKMLHLTTRLALGAAPEERRFVLLVDQFEEVFTLCAEEPQRRAFIDNLLYAARAAEGRTAVALTLRSDFYGHCTLYPELAAALSDRTELVGPMSEKELRHAIEEPARLAGCELEGGLTELLIRDVLGEIGGLPLLEHALLQIWQAREGRQLKVAAFRAIGGVVGALERHAEGIFSRFTPAQQEACRHLFLRLVQVDENREVTKRRLAAEELVSSHDPEGDRQAASAVLTDLTRERLLTTEAAGEERHPTVELAHEALLAHWPRLGQWIEADRKSLRTRRQLDEAVAEWLANSREPSFLYRGARLAQAEEWAAQHPDEMGTRAAGFLAASLAERDQEARHELDHVRSLEEEQRRRADAEQRRADELTQGRRRLKKWAIAAAATAAIAVGAALAAFLLRQVAVRQRQIARAGEIAERSRTTGASNPQLGLLLALESLKLAGKAGDPYLPGAQSALRWALARSGGTPLPSGPVLAMVMLRSRNLLATVGADRHLRVWNVGPPFAGRDLGALPDSISLLAASPNGAWLLIAGAQSTRLLDLRKPDAKLAAADVFPGEDWVKADYPFSPDGRWLATRRDNLLVLRDLSQRPPLRVSQLSSQRLQAFTFSSDSHALATASTGGLLERWDLATLAAAAPPLQLPEAPVQKLAFGADGETLTVTTKSLTSAFVNVWSERNGALQGPRQLNRCLGADQVIRDDRNGLLSLLCASPNETLVWSLTPGTGEPEVQWPFEVKAIDFSPDRRWLALGDTKGNLYRTPFSHPLPAAGEPFSTQAPARTVAFSASGRWLLTHGRNEAPRLWAVGGLSADPGFEPQVYRGAYGQIPLLTARGELLHQDPAAGLLRLWTLAGDPAAPGFPGSENVSFLRAVNADGTWYAAVRNQSELLAWRLEGGRVLAPLRWSTGLKLQKLELSPHGRWLAGSDAKGGTTLWDLQGPKAPPSPLTNFQVVKAIAFSPDDTQVATSGLSGGVRLRSLAGGEVARTDAPDSRELSFAPEALAFSPDGKWLAAGGKDDRLLVREVGGREVILENRGGLLRFLVFSPDGEWLAAGCDDGTIQLWRWAGRWTPPTPILLPTPPGPPMPVSSLVFTPQGLLSASQDGTVRLWELQNDKLISLACQSAGRTLSEKEWRTYLLSETYQPGEPCPGLPRAPE
jgi:WD40 repeat protein